MRSNAVCCVAVPRVELRAIGGGSGGGSLALLEIAPEDEEFLSELGESGWAVSKARKNRCINEIVLGSGLTRRMKKIRGAYFTGLSFVKNSASSLVTRTLICGAGARAVRKLDELDGVAEGTEASSSRR